MSAQAAESRPEPATAVGAGPDTELLELVGAALQRFGPSLTLWYQTDRGAGARCKIIFPQPDQTQGSPA
ncbi:MAG: hypothetical protein ACREUG_06835 [Steroidobacteraceae bacterium]